MIVVGYLPVDSFDDVPDENTRKLYRGELLHKSLRMVLQPLESASSDGILAWCADGSLRHIYPIIAAWLADWPEQNDIACTLRNGCPKCMQKWRGRGQGKSSAALRDRDTALDALRAFQHDRKLARLTALRLKPLPVFWEKIPDLDIGTCFTPDLLHQLYKGLFEHVKDWVEDLLGTKEFNRRFKSMPRAQDLRYFKKGVTKVKVWSGRESREMMRQFLPVVIDAQAPPDFVRMVRALLDFSYLAQAEQLTNIDLVKMEGALASFHQAKFVLISMGIVLASKTFDRIAKLHMLGHYTESIRELGTPDGYSTETPEHLHIIYVKNGWRKSNRRNPMPQIVSYVRRLEAIQMQRTFIDEYYGERHPGAQTEEWGMGASDSDDDEVLSEWDGDDSDIDEDANNTIRIEVGDSNQSNGYRYPRPSISLARQPTVPRVPGRVLITSYGASDLIRALRRFLLPKARLRGEELLVLPSDDFDVWHKADLIHLAGVSVPNQSPQHDVIRACPPAHDSASHLKEAGIFDTALFAADGSSSGLARKWNVCVSHC